MAELGIGPEALRLDGQVALVTGASANIGAAIAASYARAGADVVVAARGLDALGRTARAIPAAACDQLGGHALDAFGRVDVLVNNAYSSGLAEGRDVLDVSDATWDEVLE